jgi:hypothetical protein
MTADDYDKPQLAAIAAHTLPRDHMRRLRVQNTGRTQAEEQR